MPLAVGAPAPDFTLVSQDRQKIGLDDLKGKRSMIVFMPYPHTRTCDSESCEIRATGRYSKISTPTSS